MRRLAEYSQYFLQSPELVKELIGHSNIRKNDTVYDIGAGSGTISSVLAERVKRVVSVEIEPRAADKLKRNMAQFPNVEVISGDFLKLALPNEPFKVFANIPFHLSSPILKKLTESDRHPKAIYLIVQKQFANKLLIEKSGFTGLLGVSIAPRWIARVRRPLKRTDYYPHPNVDTVLIEIKPREEGLIPFELMPAYRKFLEACFSDPKKFAKTARTPAGISHSLRPSQLTTDQWVRLFTASKK